MGHIVSSPLPGFASLADAKAWALGVFADDAAVTGTLFASLPFGPVAVHADGTASMAEYVAGESGSTRVVVAL